MSNARFRLFLPALLGLAYFILFPGDLEALLQPFRQVLSLTQSIAPAAYGLALAIPAWFITRAVLAARDRRGSGATEDSHTT